MLAAMPAMLTDIVLQLAVREPAIGAIERLPAGADLLAAAHRFQPDVFIGSAADQAVLASLQQLLYAHPQARVLLISADGREAQLARLVPAATVLQDFSADDLMDAVLGRTLVNGTPWT